MIGFLLLHQVPNLLAVLGIGLVVVAGIGAERHGSRSPLQTGSNRPEADKPAPAALFDLGGCTAE
jgi:inner membrane transporter RhtA